MEHSWESVPQAIRKRVEPFLSELTIKAPSMPVSIYLVGPSARGEFSEVNPEIHILLVYEVIEKLLLDFISSLGAKFGSKGLRAPLLLTREHLRDAADVFPIELLDYKHSHTRISGEPLLEGMCVEKAHLKIQCERELRLWQIHLRQGYIKAAGDGSWLAGWFLERVPDLFPVLRAVLFLLGGDPDAGNTEAALRLSEATKTDLSPIIEIWTMRKTGTKLSGKKATEYFEKWTGAMDRLMKIVDELRE